VIRVYEDPGRLPREYRVLVDRLWPRGVPKVSLDLDDWMKDVAPSTELRRSYGHRPEYFEQFASSYKAELRREPGTTALHRLREVMKDFDLVLLTATKDVEHSAAKVLMSLLLAN